jgi:protein-disulfide isomerase
MQPSKSTLIILAGAALMVAGVFVALFMARGNVGSDGIPALASNKEDIERIVKNYLLENPEVIFEAVRRMETKENDQRMSRMKEGAKKHAADLFNRPDAIVAGNPNGDVTIVEFFDYKCGYCRKIVPELSQLIKQDGNIRLVMKEFPILSRDSEMAARAAIASVKQGKYWDFHIALMSADEITQESVMAIAKGVGIDTVKLAADMAAPSSSDVISRNHELAQKLGIEATPTFYIGDTPYAGALPLSELKAAVAAARKAKKGG